MASETFQIYRHTGKFGIHGPALALLAAVVAGFPLGYAYAYLIKWIPFIYLNFLITAGYGFVFGILTGALMKFGKVRNTLLAVLCGILAGVLALYFAWNAHIHSLSKDAPALFLPGQILAAMRFLYENGSWGMRSSGNVTGIPLAIVWAVEGTMIVGLSAFVPFSMISDTPFCEQSRCWLDEEKKIDTLEAFSDPAQSAAFKAGDLGPLSQARPRASGSTAFARLTLKHSPRCDQFCTVSIANVTVVTDKDGNTSEQTQELARNVMLPKSMFELITKFEGFKTASPAAS